MYPIKEANKLISNGTHKWCVGHLDAVPIATMSIDDRYCQACYDLLQGETSLLAL